MDLTLELCVIFYRYLNILTFEDNIALEGSSSQAHGQII